MAHKEPNPRVPEQGWRTETPLSEWLYAEAYRFDFFQAVRLLERMRPECAPTGEGSDPDREAVRFSSTIRLDFPPSDIESLAPSASADAPAHMAVNFFGVAGGEGPLPPPLVELLQDRMRERDYGPRDFLDIFNHRLISLLFRGARAHRPALTPGTPEESAAGRFAQALAGFAHAGVRRRMAVPDQALLRYAGLLCQHPQPAVGLERMLADYFQWPFAIRQMCGKWFPLLPEERTAIGSEGRHHRLGGGAALGARVWNQAGAFTIEAGPLTLAQFFELLPGGAALPALRDLARLYAGTLYDFSICLLLRADQVPAARLGKARLGWTAWLPTGAARAEPRRVCFAGQPA